MAGETKRHPFDAETRALLQDFLAKIPHPVEIRVWGDPRSSHGEREAARLVKGLSDDFEQIEMAIHPRRDDYPYYPVLGVFGLEEEERVDFGVRIIGLPAGVQITSLIAAVQAVSFRGTTLEPKTRVQLSGLQSAVNLELISSAEDELGTLMSKTVFGLAVSSTHVRSYLIMADVFPEIMWRYSVRHVPHLVINGRVHIDGEIDEESLLRHIAGALKSGS